MIPWLSPQWRPLSAVIGQLRNIPSTRTIAAVLNELVDPLPLHDDRLRCVAHFYSSHYMIQEPALPLKSTHCVAQRIGTASTAVNFSHAHGRIIAGMRAQS